jgi:hypothetical protein
MTSAIVSQGPTKDNGPLIRSQQALPDRVVVLVRGAPGLTSGQAYRVCRPTEPISTIELWTAGYKNFLVVSTVEAEELRHFSLETGDYHYRFDVSVKVRGRVTDVVTHLKDITHQGGVSRFQGVFSAIENALRETAKELSAPEFDKFKRRLSRVSDRYPTAQETQNGILILRCDFDARPGSELLVEMEASRLLSAWYQEGGKEYVYAKAALSTDPSAREKAERFIRAMELRESEVRQDKQRDFDEGIRQAGLRIDLQIKLNSERLRLYNELVNSGLEHERVMQMMRLGDDAGAELKALSHGEQLPAATTRPALERPAPGLLRFIGTADDDDDVLD